MAVRLARLAFVGRILGPFGCRIDILAAEQFSLAAQMLGGH
jgi:hypothetical protein